MGFDWHVGEGNRYRTASLEEDDFFAGPSAVAKGADRLGRLIRVGGQEVVQTLVSEGGQEPFTWTRLVRIYRENPLVESQKTTYMYGPGSPLRALKQSAVSSMRTGPWTCCN